MIMNDLFDAYVSRITPTEPEFERARQHRHTVQSRIKLEGVREFLNSGSYIKRTAIRPFEDIDLFVAFDANLYEKEERNIVSRLAYYLNQSFPGKTRTQRHSVGVTFADGMRVDVVPGFAVRDRPGYFRLRNREEDRWIETSIVGHKDFFKKRQDGDARFRAMVQLVKSWKQERRMKIGSYLMELLVARAFRNGIPQGKDVALHEFFSWVANDGLAKPVVFTDFYRVSDVERMPGGALIVLDPTNWRNNVASSLTSAGLAELKNVTDRARARSGTALGETSRQRAASIWRELLADFPSP